MIEAIGMAVCGAILTVTWAIVCWLVGEEDD